MKVKWTYSCIFQNVTIGLGLYLCLKRRYRFFLKQKRKKKIIVFFFLAKNSKFKPKKFKIKHKPKKFKIEHKPRKFKIKHVLQNTRTQTHESPLIQQKQPKSNTKSIQGTQKHKLKNTNPFKHKHNISNRIAQIQAQIQ